MVVGVEIVYFLLICWVEQRSIVELPCIILTYIRCHLQFYLFIRGKQ